MRTAGLYLGWAPHMPGSRLWAVSKTAALPLRSGRRPRTEIWGMKKAWPWEQAPLPIPPFLTVRNSGPLSAMVAHILNGDGNSEWQVLSPWGWEGPGRESGLSHMRGTMFPRHSPGWSTWHGGRGTVPGLKAC